MNKGNHLGKETRFTHFRFYREQLDQLATIYQYFQQVRVEPAKRTNEEIKTLALKQFHAFVSSLQSP
ncbi:hypothetical protein [Halalkalibacterium halodurans]|uniref:hypothetical protein n=1 Tax=Halalkalibacterium halodurans TaxID=86665 RepID=UPI002AA9A244|nr:hypothetical protein [Halalkalibacterium halodurans]MDY7223427.1 hypothetical protein [Halalkalibacterium halodurans]MDY7242648.1 hypothetical protein [Halalkalibacterium halodurans]